MYIVTAKEMYDIDHFAMTEIGLDGKLLMENAGRAVADRVTAIVKDTDKICVLAGSGNNGGDGFVIARTLLDKGYAVQVLQVVANDKILGDAYYHKRLFERCGGIISLFEGKCTSMITSNNVIIDAIIGIGSKGILREPLASLVHYINREAKKVISVDIPSGLPADEGKGEFISIQADYTFVIGAPKVSAFLNHTSPYYGKWEPVSIGLPSRAFKTNTSRFVWGIDDVRNSLPDRKPDDHKGEHGKGLVIGGSKEMPGALAMSLKASLRAGAGLITGATTEGVIRMLSANCIEATYKELSETNGFLDNRTDVSLEGYHAVAIGMGMGRRTCTGDLVRSLVHTAECPIVIDADGLYHIKEDLLDIENRRYPTVITPHPGEMAMLLGITVNELLLEPFRYSREFAIKNNSYVVLKGMITIITSPEGEQVVNMSGNPGLAKGGSGDVLTGIILAMIMQGQTIFQALCNACYIHGRSADELISEKHSYHDLLASDVIDGLAKVFRIIS
ncbi:NAD(P)H-hydrate dehydratase [Virgibacillus sp. AGTR]|uniref:NAD(P)H-hydrate dehydratase n=1 Tax=Virgibacillus sp. AGTR TaxID=2812055 RepID=UPI001966886B|nr:NAD(P)H-hydrate dehydratase [Virgibacillus sp. AGTR]MCC2251639.1 NAD(P)H-hydrate dehydratase [Virgibacillus sp. AGTR]QRZ19673.1 NAD(P)H-hydrate dehydratase [Virgibacillus sp. AGTR]